jgi:hypothetical protein
MIVKIQSPQVQCKVTFQAIKQSRNYRQKRKLDQVSIKKSHILEKTYTITKKSITSS